MLLNLLPASFAPVGIVWHDIPLNVGWTSNFQNFIYMQENTFNTNNHHVREKLLLLVLEINCNFMFDATKWSSMIDYGLKIWWEIMISYQFWGMFKLNSHYFWSKFKYHWPSIVELFCWTAIYFGEKRGKFVDWWQKSIPIFRYQFNWPNQTNWL